jgi:hypothetical protein
MATYTYKQRPTRSCEVLHGKNNYPDAGTILDISLASNTAIPAGSRGRIIYSGDHMYEADRPGVPVRFVGNNTVFSMIYPCDPAKIPAIVAKLRRKGFNFIRLHHVEAYLQNFGPLYSTPAIGPSGPMQFNPVRLAEIDQFLAAWKEAGGYYSFGPCASNMAFNLNGLDRFTTATNTSGTFTVTIDPVTGAITSATPATPSTGHYYPPCPYVLDVEGQSGAGARFKCTINAQGTVDNIEVVEGGAGYSSSVQCKYYGNVGSCITRLSEDLTVQENYDLMVQYLLNRPSTVTGIAWKDDPACVFMECANESSRINLTLANGNVYNDLYLASWHRWLRNRFGTIAAFNQKTGASATGFCDVALRPKVPTFSPTTTLDRWLFKESMYWIATSDYDHYMRCIATIRAAGWTGAIATRDTGADPMNARINCVIDNGMQTYHSYSSINDRFAAGETIFSNYIAQNAPCQHSGGVIGANDLMDCTTFLVKNKPKWMTEAGHTFWNKYRAEFSPTYTAISSMHDFTGIVYHGSYLVNLKFGPDDNGTLDKKLRPHGYENDVCLIPGHFFGNLAFHQRMITAVTPTKTYVMNDRALSFHANLNDIADGSAPISIYRQTAIPAEVRPIHLCSTWVTEWDPTNSTTIANTWRSDISRTVPQLMVDHGVANDQHPTYNWYTTRGNNANNSDAVWTAMRWSANREIFMDRLLGIFGINTPRMQLVVSHKEYIQRMGSLHKQGILPADATSKTTRVIPGNGYIYNHLGQRLWQNLQVHHLESGILLGVAAMDGNPVSTSQRMVVGIGSPTYNTDLTFSANGNCIESCPITAGGTWTAPPMIYATGGGGRVPAYGVGILSGGALVDIDWIEPGDGYTSSPTLTIVGSGSGATLGTPVMVPSDPNREVKVLNTGTFPIRSSIHVVKFSLDDVLTNGTWRLYELGYDGQRIPGGEIPVQRIKNGISIRIDTAKTVQPSAFFELVLN